MKKFIFLLAFISLFLFVSPASAKVIMQEKGMVTIDQAEVIDDDLFVGAENVTIEGTVKGSVFVGAGSVTVTGIITDDLFVGAGNLTVTGAEIGGNLIVGAGQVIIDDKAKIGGSLVAGAGSLQNSAPITRNLMLGAGTAYLNSAVGKELRFGGGSLELGPRAKIAGNLTYALGDEQGVYKQADEASIAGSVKKISPPVHDWQKTKESVGRAGMAASRGLLLFSYLGAVIIGLIVLKIFPRTFDGLVKVLNGNLGKSLGTGFLLVMLIVPVLLALAFTIIGLPLVGLLIPLLILGFYFAKIISSYAFGQLIAKQFSWNKMSNFAKLFVGLTVFYLLRAIPAVGWLITVLFSWTGLGAIWQFTRSHIKSL